MLNWNTGAGIFKIAYNLVSWIHHPKFLNRKSK